MILGCLALNASFEPLTMVPMRRALRLVIDGKAEIVEAEQDRMVRSERLTMPRDTESGSRSPPRRQRQRSRQPSLSRSCSFPP